VRVLVSLMVLVAGCTAEREPVTGSGVLEEAPVQEEGVAHAQERRAPPPQPAVPDVPPAPGEQRAPDRYTVRFDTTKGPILIDVTRAWAPHGADRFYRLVREGYYTDIAWFRVVAGFMAQTGIHGDPAMNVQWRDRNIPDDPVREHNTRGMVSYAMAGPGSRTTQFFINLVDNSRLDPMGFAPFGRVRDMAAVERLHSGYGDGPPRGQGPEQGRMQAEGNTYLRASFPQLDYIRSATIEP
jgi:peptidyl-prolyl cis-trans isomerase A (cyclophilin A)